MTKVSTKATPKRRTFSAEHRAKLSEAAKRRHARGRAAALPARLTKQDAIKAELQALRVEAARIYRRAEDANRRIHFMTRMLGRRDWVIISALVVGIFINLVHYIAWLAEVN